MTYDEALDASKGEAKWSGKAPIPDIGDVVICNDRHGTRCVVTGYAVEHGWLMVVGHREADPSFKGNLAGAEISRNEPSA